MLRAEQKLTCLFCLVSMPLGEDDAFTAWLSSEILAILLSEFRRVKIC
jgi:hypothetical protein